MSLDSLPALRADIAASAETIIMNGAVQEALRITKEQQNLRIEEQIALTEIPSPPFKETKRAEAFAELLKKYSAEHVLIDSEGNVRSCIPGDPNGPKLVVAAHLDSVFKEGTDVKVHKDENGILHAPGVSDDTCGLSALLQIVRAIKEGGLKLCGDLYVVGTVGEEGNGDLRGSKFLWSGEHGFDGFISIDSANVNRLLKGSVGSKRFRVTFTGPGGHSLRRFGEIASATHALARVGAKIADIQTPKSPVTTFTVGVISGGTGVNAIAANAEMEIDTRSESPEELDKLVNQVLSCIETGTKEENERWGVTGENAVTAQVKQIGFRPAGQNKDDSPVLHAARAAMKELGIELKRYICASTDQNIPLSLGIPATTLGGGGAEANNHSLNEWFDPTDAYQGPQLALLTILILLGVEGVSPAMLNKQ